MGALDRVFRGRRGVSQERPLAAIIAGLWRNGEQGVWYDPTDISTMFQDAAGTLPVYAPGQGQVDPPVGRILDKSGRGNHAYQATTTSRPTLSARCNLLMGTEALATQSVNVVAASYTLRFAGTGFVTLSGAAAGTYSAGSRSITCTAGSLTLTVSGGVAQADLRAANDGVGLPPYQRVVDSNTYDTIGFPLYRKPDGADDWMQTASVDFTGADKVTLAMALRKQSDALIGIAVELSADSNANVGTFALFAPISAGAGTIGARSKGTVASLDSSPAVYPAPASVVAVMQASIPDDLLALRFNGVAKTPVSSDQGTGTYGNYPIYFDRRGGASTTFGGRDYGTIIVGRLLTGPETAAVEKLLRQKSRAY